MPGRGLAILAILLLLAAAAAYTLVTGLRGGVVVAVLDVDKYDLSSDFAYKYFDIIEKELLRDTGSFKARSELLNDVCEKYKDPFRVENRGLYHSHPPMNHFTFSTHAGRTLAMCSSLKSGSNSWRIFMDKVQEAQGEQAAAAGAVPAGGGVAANATCWPACGAREQAVQVRHPLQRLLSAYRHLFERTGAYEDQYVAVASLRQLLGGELPKITWPEFVEKLLANQLTSHPALHRLGGAQVVGGAVRREGGQGGREGEEVSSPGMWVAGHWAPYWYTCGLCNPSTRPATILHTDAMAEEAPRLLEGLGLAAGLPPYPHALRGEGGHASRWEEQYYGQLSRAQVWRLFLLYRVDHELLGYSPRKYLDWAKE